MSQRPIAFSDDEWYHCYSRSIDRQPVFKDTADYNRFLESLYLCNGNRRLLRSAMYRPSHEHLLTLERGSPLVAVGAYCLMPNHFHLLLRQVSDNGISTFMQKVGTSFSMYYNTKYEHIGNVFIKPFRAKHIEKDDYFQQIVQYIHLNPVEIFEPRWKEAVVRDMKRLPQKLKSYQYSSFLDFDGLKRPENAIVDQSVIQMLEKPPNMQDMLFEAAAYYRDLDL
jgi:putative transposase